MSTTAPVSSPPRAASLSRQARGALAVLAAAIAALGLWGYAGLADLGERGRAIKQKKSELAALIQRTGAKGGAKAGLADPFLGGANASLASNALQERVVGVIEEAGGNVVSVNVEPPSGAAPAGSPVPAGRRLVLQASAEMTIDGLQRMLHRLEGETPALIIENLLVDRRSAAGGELDDPTKPTRLRVDVRIAGFARAGATTP